MKTACLNCQGTILRAVAQGMVHQFQGQRRCKDFLPHHTDHQLQPGSEQPLFSPCGQRAHRNKNKQRMRQHEATSKVVRHFSVIAPVATAICPSLGLFVRWPELLSSSVFPLGSSLFSSKVPLQVAKRNLVGLQEHQRANAVEHVLNVLCLLMSLGG